MAKIITQINQTQGNYQDVFLYTINASFNGIAETIDEAQIRILFPGTLEVYLGDIQEPVKNVTQDTLDNGTLYTFDFGSISDLGIAVRLGMGVVFQPTATNETTVSVTPELWINGALYDSFTSDSIQLLVNPNFLVTHEQIIPQVNAAPNGVIYYRVLLKNYGDLGGAINDVEIICNCPECFLPDGTYTIIGEDVSSGSFGDTSQDGIQGVIENNNVRFTLSSFYGEAYAFIYRVIIDSTISIDQNYTSFISWSMDQIQQEGFTGFYRFSNLELGAYYVRFFLDTNSHDFSKGSLVDSNGVTPLINLRDVPYADDIIVGICALRDRKIEELLQVNRSSNSMLRNVIYDQMLIGMKMEALDL